MERKQRLSQMYPNGFKQIIFPVFLISVVTYNTNAFAVPVTITPPVPVDLYLGGIYPESFATTLDVNADGIADISLSSQRNFNYISEYYTIPSGDIYVPDISISRTGMETQIVSTITAINGGIVPDLPTPSGQEASAPSTSQNLRTVGESYIETCIDFSCNWDISATNTGLLGSGGPSQGNIIFSFMIDSALHWGWVQLSTTDYILTVDLPSSLQVSAWGWETNPNTLLSIDAVNPAVVPIPPAIWLLGSSLVGLIGFARRRQRNSFL